jgi:hypothetical protein
MNKWDTTTRLLVIAGCLGVLGLILQTLPDAALDAIFRWELKAKKNTKGWLVRHSLWLSHRRNLALRKNPYPSLSQHPSVSQNPPGARPWAQYAVAPGGILVVTDQLGVQHQWHNITNNWQTVRVDQMTGLISVVTPPVQAPPVVQWGRDRLLIEATLYHTEKPQKPKDVREVKHPIYSYRAFALRVDGRKWDVMGRVIPINPRLGAMNMGFGDWQPGVNEAVHNGIQSAHVCPEPGDHCGFWSLDDLQRAYGKLAWPADNSFIPVVGVIQGWGRFQRHTEGYRFQYASVMALTVGTPNNQITGPAIEFGDRCVRDMCVRFDVPYVETHDDLQMFKVHLDAQAHYDANP